MNLPSKLFLSASFILALAAQAWADPIAFNFQLDDSGVISGATLTIDQSLSAGGVSFTARLTAIGSGNLDQNGAGIGVIGASDNALNASEFISFAVQINGVSGGTVTFNGFDQIDLDSFEANGSVSEKAAISSDTTYDAMSDQIVDGVLGGSADIFTIAGLPTAFSIVSNGENDNNFRAAALRGTFTTTAVPEPASFGVIAPAVLIGLYRRRRT